MKKILNLIILTLKQKGIINYPEMVELLDQTKNATTTNLRRDRREKTRRKRDKADV